MKKRPHILTIAGFDPSGGAGLVADVKTIENIRCYGLSVCTANTIQNDTDFKACYWTPIAQIKEQIEILFDRFEIQFVKIGIIENWSVLHEIISLLQTKNTDIKIILDPVLKSSSAFEFHQFNEALNEVLSSLYLITPNYEEIQNLYPNKTIEETIAHISSKTNVLLKGGHRYDKIGRDELFTTQNTHFVFNPKAKQVYPKHGSGCVLASAVTAYLALDYPLLKACFRGKRYTEQFLNSTPNLLGYHL